MADNSAALQQQRGANQVPGWVPLALGTTAIAAGLASRNKGTLILAALAGATAVAVARNGQFSRDRGAAVGNEHGRQRADEAEVERSITIGRTADELYQCWRDPQALTQVMSGFASARSSGDGRMHWRVDAPMGRTYEWDSETVDDRPGERIGWRSVDGAALPNEGSVRFRPAPGDRGTVATLRFRFEPPGGALGHAALKLVGSKPLNAAADGMLRRFKSLVETGEIPTTERQPAARADTR